MDKFIAIVSSHAQFIQIGLIYCCSYFAYYVHTQCPNLLLLLLHPEWPNLQLFMLCLVVLVELA